jgi:hypothetical protein
MHWKLNGYMKSPWSGYCPPPLLATEFRLAQWAVKVELCLVSEGERMTVASVPVNHQDLCGSRLGQAQRRSKEWSLAAA